MKTSFKTRVSQMGLGSFMNINIFVIKYWALLISSTEQTLSSTSVQIAYRLYKGNGTVPWGENLVYLAERS